MGKFANYILHEKIRETRHSIIYRGQKEKEAESCIIKVLKVRYPAPSDMARFKQEYKLVKKLDADSIIRVYDLVEYDGTYAIIEEDFDGVSLKDIIKTKNSR